MQVQGGRNPGRASHARSHTYAGEYTAEDKRSAVHGISKGEERTHDIRQARKSKV